MSFPVGGATQEISYFDAADDAVLAHLFGDSGTDGLYLMVLDAGVLIPILRIWSHLRLAFHHGCAPYGSPIGLD